MSVLLTGIKVSLLVYLAAIALGALLYRRPRAWNYSVHALSALASLIAAFASGHALFSGQNLKLTIVFPRQLAFLPPLHLVADTLSCFMILVISIVSFYTSVFAFSYVKSYFEHKGKLLLLGLCYPSFIASMLLVVLAGDVIFFLVFWEVMSVTSYFLILTEYEEPSVRKASMMYIIYASLSGICLLAAFAIGYVATGSLVFEEWKSLGLTPLFAWTVFLLSLLGFGAKGGVVPLHSWLPEAHPAAPSHVSALLSGVMVKVAMYGIVRVALDALAPAASPVWGLIILVLGALSTFYGVALALVQHDIKRLLAYHTIENIGIILLGIGVAVASCSFNIPALAVIGLAAGLFHLVNHALFKSLLFLCSGALLYGVGTRELAEMGGLYKRMRATAIAFLIAALGITAMPLFNGFASEWCIYNSLMLMASSTPSVSLRFLSLMSIASLAAAGALAVYCFTKVFGLVFLSRPRSERASSAEPEPLFMKAAYIVPSALIILFGLAPGLMLKPLVTLGCSLLNYGMPPLQLPFYGVLVSLWSTPSAYIPLAVTGVTGVFAFIAWSRTRAVKYVAVTEPFVSGVAYDKSMQPTAALYVGSFKELMQKFYGVKHKYEIEYAVEYWTARKVRVIEAPTATLASILSRMGYKVKSLAEAPERFDEVFSALYGLVARAFTVFAEKATPMLEYGKPSAYRRLIDHWLTLIAVKLTRRIQCGKLSWYIAYIYVAFIMLLIYYVALG